MLEMFNNGKLGGDAEKSIERKLQDKEIEV
jgi:hypothetical protein